MKTILLAGPSSAGKTTLSRALIATGQRRHVSTSAHLRNMTNDHTLNGLFNAGENLDRLQPAWLRELSERVQPDQAAIVDSIRSRSQDLQFGGSVVRVNVRAEYPDLDARATLRGRPDTWDGSYPIPYMFQHPDFVWDSSRISLATAVAAINQLSGGGVVDVLIGGQYGSEGKGKLADLLARRYHYLVRSGGPNAGHWVRSQDYEFCFHHIPSGALGNKDAGLLIAAGATIDPAGFLTEVDRLKCWDRVWVDPNTVLISEEDRLLEQELIGKVGSTAQGVGSATARRVWRRGITAGQSKDFERFVRGGIAISELLSACLSSGNRAMLEGTQGSALSLWHGPYPYCTSRDTNASGLAAEVGIPPSQVGDVWMVLRTFPIRVGGNSGPMYGEMQWEDVATQAGLEPQLLKSSELTSTTKRQRRVGKFDFEQFGRAVQLNRPTRLFVTMADYLTPDARGLRDWGKLPDQVLTFCQSLEEYGGVPVAGVSTGRSRDDVAWRFSGY